jgi:hypothetical protein
VGGAVTLLPLYYFMACIGVKNTLRRGYTQFWRKDDNRILLPYPFPCWVGLVDSRPLRELEGLLFRLIYIGGLCKPHDQLQLAGPLIRT